MPLACFTFFGFWLYTANPFYCTMHLCMFAGYRFNLFIHYCGLQLIEFRADSETGCEVTKFDSELVAIVVVQYHRVSEYNMGKCKLNHRTSNYPSNFNIFMCGCFSM